MVVIKHLDCSTMTAENLAQTCDIWTAFKLPYNKGTSLKLKSYPHLNHHEVFEKGIIGLSKSPDQVCPFWNSLGKIFFVLFSSSNDEPHLGTDSLQLNPRQGLLMAELLQYTGNIWTGCNKGLQRFSMESSELCCTVIFIHHPTMLFLSSAEEDVKLGRMPL